MHISCVVSNFHRPQRQRRKKNHPIKKQPAKQPVRLLPAKNTPAADASNNTAATAPAAFKRSSSKVSLRAASEVAAESNSTVGAGGATIATAGSGKKVHKSSYCQDVAQSGVDRELIARAAAEGARAKAGKGSSVTLKPAKASTEDEVMDG